MPTGPDRRNLAGVVVPLRSFGAGKARLATLLDGDARAALAQSMADRVVDATGDLPTVIVSSEPAVVAWAAMRGCAVIADPGTLDLAADAGRAWVRDQGLGRVVVVHADLPLASSLAVVARGGDAPVVTIVPDHRDDGTPVLALPVAAPFRFSYGPGSAARHIAEGRRCGLTVQVERDASLAFDVDVEEDLRALDAWRDNLTR